MAEMFSHIDYLQNENKLLKSENKLPRRVLTMPDGEQKSFGLVQERP